MWKEEKNGERLNEREHSVMHVNLLQIEKPLYKPTYKCDYAPQPSWYESSECYVEQCWAMLSNIELGCARLGYYYYGTTNKNNNKAWCNFLHNNQGQSQIKRTSHISNIPQTLTVNKWKHPNSYPKLTHGWRLTALDLDLLDLIILLYKWHLDVSERAN